MYRFWPPPDSFYENQEPPLPDEEEFREPRLEFLEDVNIPDLDCPPYPDHTWTGIYVDGIQYCEECQVCLTKRISL